MNKLIYLIVLIFIFFITNAEARRGCCSWHGGVSGCDDTVGRLICNDGTYSPTCGCEIKEQDKQPKKKKPIKKKGKSNK